MSLFNNIHDIIVAEGEDDDDEYRPSIGEASSIILLTLCILCTLSSLYVAYKVYRIGANTASSKLIIYLTLTHTNMNFAKTPFLFNMIPHGCVISGILFFYSYVQLYLISYYMIVCSRSLLLEGAALFDSESMNNCNKSSYELNSTCTRILFLLPLLTLVLPLSTNAFEEKFNWCGINPDSRYGFYVFLQLLVAFAIISILIFRELYKIFYELYRANAYLTDLFIQFLKGSAIIIL